MCFAKYTMTDSLDIPCELPAGKQTLQKAARPKAVIDI